MIHPPVRIRGEVLKLSTNPIPRTVPAMARGALLSTSRRPPVRRRWRVTRYPMGMPRPTAARVPSVAKR
jgi:hypothetical protein